MSEQNVNELSFIQWFRNNQRSIGIDLMAGTTSGICNCLSAQPLDTIKVRLQISNHSFKEVVTNTFKNEGILAFYKGMSFPLLAVPMVNACVFTTYEFWKRLLQNNDGSPMEYWKTCICGFFAGSATACISSPVELAKIRLQAQTKQILKNPFQIMRMIIQTEGFRGLYRGHFATQFRETTSYAGQFLFYEVSRDFLHQYLNFDKQSNFVIFLSGGIGGIVSWLVSYPQDTVKTILQLQTTNKINRIYKHHKFIPDGGFFDCFSITLKNKGHYGLWKGLTTTCVRAFYADAVGFFSFEYARNLIENKIFKH